MRMERRRAYVVDWQELPRWDLKSARAAAFHTAHPSFQPLGCFVEEATEIVHANREPNHEWPVYGVNNKEGVTFSHLQKGASFNSAYKRIREDWFFHNPTRANVGSLGRVPAVPPDAITSPEYQVWRIKEGLLPDFLEILIRMPFFLEQIDCHRVGAVKERLFVENLREIPIPVLDTRTQRAIVARWRKTKEAIATANDNARRIADTLEVHLLETIGLRIEQPSPNRGAFSLSWSDLERWDTFFYRKDFVALKESLSGLTCSNLGDLAHFISRPWSPNHFPNGKFQYVEISGVDKEAGIFASHEVDVKDAPSRATTLLRTGDIILSSTRPYLGAFAIVPSRFNNCVCSSGFAIADRVDSRRILKEYLLFFLRSPAGLKQMEQRMTGGLYPAITQGQLERIIVPTPPLPVQTELMERVSAGRAKIDIEHKRAEQKAHNMSADFEELILGSKPFTE